jgi:hypothetical protein
MPIGASEPIATPTIAFWSTCPSNSCRVALIARSSPAQPPTSGTSEPATS